MEVPPGGAAEHADEGRLLELGDLADRLDPDLAELPPGCRPDSPEALDGEGVEEVELLPGRDAQEAVGLRHAARNLGEELRTRDSDRDGNADALADVAAEALGDLARGARDSAHPADVEEGLVDGQALNKRRRVLEDAVESLARLRVGGHARRNDDRARGRGGGPGLRPSRSGSRMPSPRSSRRGRHPPPTITGRPRRRGSSRCSTEAKNESASACRIVASFHTNTCSHRARSAMPR